MQERLLVAYTKKGKDKKSFPLSVYLIISIALSPCFTAPEAIIFISE